MIFILVYSLVGLAYEARCIRLLISETTLVEILQVSSEKRWMSWTYVIGTFVILVFPGLPRLCGIFLLVMSLITAKVYAGTFLEGGTFVPRRKTKTFWFFDTAVSSALLASLLVYAVKGL